jgi:negative regulator of sigma E activity
MKSVNVRELLTAAADGELTPAEKKAARRILRESEAARALFAQLKADAARLKKLPRVPAPADLADNVLAAITDRAMAPTPLPPSPRGRHRFNWNWLPVWANMAAAAGVLVAITLGSYFYFSASDRYFASKDKDAGTAQLPPVRMPEVMVPGDPVDAVSDPHQLGANPGPEAIVRRGPEVGPIPREVINPNIETGPVPDAVPEIEPFDPAKIRVSLLIKPEELGAPEVRKKLATEMKKDELIRLDLFCHSTPKALERVAAALKSRGVTTLTDGYAHERLQKKQPTELMVFTEALTPDEVAQVMAALGAGDKDGGLFDTLVAAPFLEQDLVKLGRLLGVPNVTSKLPRAKSGVDIRKPLPEGTADHVAKSLSGMGGDSPRPPKAEHMAVVVAYSPANANPSASREIKQFVDRRGERKPGAKPLMLVLKVISK